MGWNLFENIGKAWTDVKKVFKGELSVGKAISYGVNALPDVANDIGQFLSDPVGTVTGVATDFLGKSKEIDERAKNNPSMTLDDFAKISSRFGAELGKLAPKNIEKSIQVVNNVGSTPKRVEKNMPVANTVGKTVAKKGGVSIGKLIPFIIPFLL